ncbi:hypothetical protein [Salisaeta longa]|uniref:hypothetical protein n=1 Tax=Salisaeta longa TaxID=503170 RepID=UPI0003B4964C|nr:hypothetical protein [Salisaeta longa]
MADDSQRALRTLLVERIDGVSAEVERTLQDGAHPGYIQAQLREATDERRWMWAVTGTILLMALVVPTAILREWMFTAGAVPRYAFLLAMVGACAFAASLGGWAYHTYMTWQRKVDALRALHLLATARHASTATA